ARGPAGWALKGLKILRIDPVGVIADASVRGIIAHFEERLEPGPGLYHLGATTLLGSRISAASDLSGANPYLVFVHGTASSTAGSFGGLVGTEEWKALHER